MVRLIISLRWGYSFLTCIAVAFNKSDLWTNIHIMTTVLCACLPVYKPLCALVGNFVGGLRGRYGSSWQYLLTRSKHKISTRKSDDVEPGGFEDNYQLADPYPVPSPDETVTQSVQAHRNEASQGFVTPLRGISSPSKAESAVEII